ncbi:acylphosphatase [Desulfohalobiaceae bacterium Ax17]|uniref:acylphosphatase n=1 Tax=Desulfovulcanus ferrireducens TaxID=2831190 RepID=UPI00207B9B58|nr:acylphosphatase [Desulfovulcanus ferrireducens]MBT8762682.1 acylphosphatase [Desulfovulcanus ferrireducens]
MKSMHCLVSGKVQGVYFRAWTHDQAKNLNLTGWVRNLKEGQVEILAQGDEENLNELKKRLFQGSPLSRVESVHCEFIDYDKTYDKFEIRG